MSNSIDLNKFNLLKKDRIINEMKIFDNFSNVFKKNNDIYIEFTREDNIKVFYTITLGKYYPIDPPLVTSLNSNLPDIESIQRHDFYECDNVGYNCNMSLLDIYMILKDNTSNLTSDEISVDDIRISDELVLSQNTTIGKNKFKVIKKSHVKYNNIYDHLNNLDDDYTDDQTDITINNNSVNLDEDTLKLILDLLPMELKQKTSTSTKSMSFLNLIDANEKESFIERNNKISKSISCYISGKTDIQTLGICLDVEFNPKTKCLSKVLVHQGYLSYSAFRCGIKTTNSGKIYNLWLPLVLGSKIPRSFETTIAIMNKSFIKEGNKNIPNFEIEMVVPTMVKILSSFVHLIADKVKPITNEMLDIYCQLHAMTCNLTNVYKLSDSMNYLNLLNEADEVKRYTLFNKKEMPDIGDLLIKQNLINFKISFHYIFEEFMARLVLWWYASDIKYASYIKDEDYNDLFSISKVGIRIFCINILLSKNILEASSIWQYRCPLVNKNDFRHEVNNIYNISSFEEFLNYCSINKSVNEVISNAVKISKIQKYQENVDFMKIQKMKGTQLMRGESKRVEIKNIRLELQGTPGILCGAVHTYHGDEFRETICYSNRFTKGIVHSGDNYINGKSIHSIEINLEELEEGEESIDKLFVTLSSCGTNNLQQFNEVVIELTDSKNPNDNLINYHLENSIGASKSCVMAKITKDQQNYWNITALGLTCKDRCCGNYNVVYQLINSLNKRDKFNF